MYVCLEVSVWHLANFSVPSLNCADTGRPWSNGGLMLIHRIQCGLALNQHWFNVSRLLGLSWSQAWCVMIWCFQVRRSVTVSVTIVKINNDFPIETYWALLLGSPCSFALRIQNETKRSHLFKLCQKLNKLQWFNHASLKIVIPISGWNDRLRKRGLISHEFSRKKSIDIWNLWTSSSHV